MSAAQTPEGPGTHAFGMDIGGTGMKGAVVNLTDGTLAAPRFRLRAVGQQSSQRLGRPSPRWHDRLAPHRRLPDGFRP